MFRNARWFLLGRAVATAVVMLSTFVAACGPAPTPPPEATPVPEATRAPAATPTPAAPPAEKPELSIIWFAWPPCEALGELAGQYPGNATVTTNCVPLGQ